MTEGVGFTETEALVGVAATSADGVTTIAFSVPGLSAANSEAAIAG